jgi:aspartate racemase
MKTAGIIGGLGPEATMVYYRSIIARYRERTRGDSNPSFLINSIDVKKMLGLIAAGSLPAVTDYLLGEVLKLHRAGADFGAFSANAPHIVFDAVQRRSPIPLVSIVETACSVARDLGLKRVGLLGIRFTMQGSFYPEVFDPAGISLVAPASADFEYVHDKYANELLNGVVLPETRAGLLAVIDRMRERDRIEGVILGGTELALMFDEEKVGDLPLLNTTKLHVDAIVERILS